MDDDAITKTMEKIEKLLRTADGKANEHEATVALQLAQKLADAHNLDIEGLRTKGDDSGKKRDEQLFAGGLYPYQRKLYKAVAELNHCLYWVRKGTYKGQKFQHRLVGSKVNVLLSKQMGTYLQDTVERLAREYCEGDATKYFTRHTHSYREGIIDRVVEKIQAKRRQDVADAAERRKNQQTGDGMTLVLIDDVIQREKEANYDFQYGEGAWARQQAASAEFQARAKRAAEEYAEWERCHPEEAAMAKAKQAEETARWYREEAKRASRRKAPVYREKRDNRDYSGYSAGYQKGAGVGIDRQVDGTKVAGSLK
jgi:hypothetical protein